MDSNAAAPLAGLSPDSVTPDDVDEADVRAALDASEPSVRQRGLAVCRALATADADAVAPFLDTVASLVADENALTARRAVGVLDAVASARPDALDGHLDPVVDAITVEHADVRFAVADLLGTLAVERHETVAPHLDGLLEALAATESDPTPDGYADVVDDRVTRRTLRKQDAADRNRRTGARRTLANVVVAVAEQAPTDATAVLERAPGLFEDADHRVAGAAVDAVGELAAADAAGVDDIADAIRDRLDHEAPFVRVRAVRALGHLGDDAAVDDLRRLAAAGDDETVRDLAATTADFLADD